MPPETVEWLYSLQPVGVKPGLERIGRLLEAIGSPHDSYRSVLVGGTNGKGSCARALAACLDAAATRTALFTSPHLIRLGERFTVAGREAAEEEVASVLEEVRSPAEELGASFFEVVTAAACLHFAREGVELAVMEVGLGGRFDATNALDPVLSVITGIALDHTAMLGTTVEAIAGEKAGIMRNARPTLTGARGAALATLESIAQERGVPLWRLGTEITVEGEELGWQGVRLRVECPAGSAGAQSPLVGRHQLDNLALAAAAALALGTGTEAVASGLAATHWPGRLERVRYRDRWVVLDGAHNEQAADALAGVMARLAPGGYTLLTGVGADKDLAAITRALASGARRVVATRALRNPRAREAETVASAYRDRWGRKIVVEAVTPPAAALERAVALSSPDDTVLVAGSLYLVGEIRPLLFGEEPEGVERWQ